MFREGEDLEFVAVGNDEMNEDLAGETWDSFESSDYYENLDNLQTHNEAATSTTRTTKHRHNGAWGFWIINDSVNCNERQLNSINAIKRNKTP